MSHEFNTWALELAQDTETAICQCGHPESQHSHLRQGNDCVVCGCMYYRAPVDHLARAASAVMILLGALWIAALIWAIGVIL